MSLDWASSISADPVYPLYTAYIGSVPAADVPAGNENVACPLTTAAADVSTWPVPPL